MSNLTTTEETLEVPETGVLDNVTVTAGAMFIVFAVVALFVVTVSTRTSLSE